MQLLRSLLPVLVGFTGACAAPALAGVEEHWSARMAVIALQAETAGRGQTVLFGDSNTEAFWWNRDDACAVINAGFGYMNLDDAARFAGPVAAATRPSIVHVMLGTNPPVSGDPDRAAMAGDIRSIIEAFRAVGAEIVVWPVPPVGPEVTVNGDRGRRARINAILAAEAGRAGVYWDWWWPNQITHGPHVNGQVTDNAAIPQALARDGIHFTAATQASRRDRIEEWGRRIRAETGIGCGTRSAP